GILKPGAVLVTALPPDDEASAVLQAQAGRLGCRVVRPNTAPDASIDAINAGLAGAVLDELGPPLHAGLLDDATRGRARLPGRMELFKVGHLTVVLDGAHVPFNLAAVLRDLSRQPGLSGPCTAVVAFGADKDADGLLGVLGRAGVAIVATGL